MSSNKRNAGFLAANREVVKNLEKVLTDDAESFGLLGSEYILRIQNVTPEGIEFYVRPYNRNGQTINFVIKGNTLTTKT